MTHTYFFGSTFVLKVYNIDFVQEDKKSYYKIIIVRFVLVFIALMLSSRKSKFKFIKESVFMFILTRQTYDLLHWIIIVHIKIKTRQTEKSRWYFYREWTNSVSRMNINSSLLFSFLHFVSRQEFLCRIFFVIHTVVPGAQLTTTVFDTRIINF